MSVDVSGCDGGFMGSDSDMWFKLMFESQQRVEHLLGELVQAQRSSESGPGGAEPERWRSRVRGSAVGLDRNSQVLAQCDGPQRMTTPCSLMPATAVKSTGINTPRAGRSLSLSSACIVPPNPALLGGSVEAGEDLAPGQLPDGPPGASGGGDQAMAMLESLSEEDGSMPEQQRSVARRLSRVKRRLPTTNHASPTLQRVSATVKSGILASLASEDLEDRPGLKPRISRLQDPNCFVHVPWGLFGLTILFVDLTLTPCIIAWDIPFSGPLVAFSLSSSIYWTLDVLLNFFIGYYKDGRLITDLKKIAKRYARSLLLPDGLIVLMDWLSLVLLLLTNNIDGSSGYRFLRFAKLGRMLRLMNLLRVLRYVRILSRLAERILSERIRVMLQTFSMSMLTLWFNHLIACTWYSIGHTSIINPDQRWTDTYQISGIEAYIVSFHWSLAQITMGSIDVVAQNWAERLFNIACLFIGLIVGTTLISTLSASMVEFQMANKDRNMKMRTLRHYLQEHAVKGDVALLVQQQVSERMREHRRLVEAQVPALSMLSVSLRTELRFEIVRPYLLKHQLFSYLSTTDFKWCMSFCQTAFSIDVLSTKDDLFLPGTPAKAAYVVMRGTLTYKFGLDEPVHMSICQSSIEYECLLEASYSHDSVAPPSWLAEGALWVEWVHVGRAVATKTCEIMTIRPEDFSRCLQRSPSAYSVVSEYGKQFHQKIMESAGQRGGEPPTDVAVACTEWEDIVVSMCEPVQQAISHATVDVMELSAGGATKRDSRSTKGPTQHDTLRKEINSGKCIMVLNKADVPERIVSVVALHISRDDGCVLAQVGKWEPDLGVVPVCELPGAKREANELNSDTLKRLLSTRLKPLAGSVRSLRTRRLIATKSSRQHQVKTKYIRYVFDCDLSSPFRAPSTTASHLGWGTELRSGSVGSQPRCRSGLGSLFSGRKSGSSVRLDIPSAAGTGEVPVMAPTLMATSQSSDEAQRADNSVQSIFGGSVAAVRVVPELLERDVFFFAHEGKGAFYAWLSQREFDQMSKPAGEPVLSDWLRALGHPPLNEELQEK